jgi:hypothetical protein
MKRRSITKVCRVSAALALVGVPGVAGADFLVVLNTGHEFTVSAYEEVGEKIVYKRFSGKVAIPKSLVVEIVDLATGEKRIFNPLPPGSSERPPR